MVADVALLFNMFLILGVLAQFGTALTLPGIAGLILVIGSSVDANVLIFERIREELSHGHSLPDAINAGYSRAFSAIFDSNVTTMLIAVILGFFGTGPVQNFAITLGIGVLTSFLSAVYVSRLIIEWMVKGNPNHPDDLHHVHLAQPVQEPELRHRGQAQNRLRLLGVLHRGRLRADVRGRAAPTWASTSRAAAPTWSTSTRAWWPPTWPTSCAPCSRGLAWR